MFCRMCGKPVHDQAVVCPACGCAPRNTTGTFCWNCGQATVPQAVACTQCGVSLGPPPMTIPGFGPGLKSRQMAGLLQLIGFLGIGGIGRLYLGDISTGILQLILSCCCVGTVWSIIDGILILTNPSHLTADGQGNPLGP